MADKVEPMADGKVAKQQFDKYGYGYGTEALEAKGAMAARGTHHAHVADNVAPNTVLDASEYKTKAGEPSHAVSEMSSCDHTPECRAKYGIGKGAGSIERCGICTYGGWSHQYGYARGGNYYLWNFYPESSCNEDRCKECTDCVLDCAEGLEVVDGKCVPPPPKEGCYKNDWGGNRVQPIWGQCMVKNECKRRAKNAGAAYYGMEYQEGCPRRWWQREQMEAQCVILSADQVRNRAESTGCGNNKLGGSYRMYVRRV